MKILHSIYTALVEQALREAPNEACGFLGFDDVIRIIYRGENDASNPQHLFSVPANWQMWARNAIAFERCQLALYHSHPRGPGQLSDTDIAATPAFVKLHLVVNLASRHSLGEWRTKIGSLLDTIPIHAFRISSAGAEEEELEIIDTVGG